MQAQNELEALQFACKYSLITNELGYCGKEKAFLEFQKFLCNPLEEKIPRIKELLNSFFSAQCYFDLIAKANAKQAFDYQVLEAYWLGNGLLENVSYRETQKTILGLQAFGLPKKIAEEKASFMPFEILPQHSMHVLHVNFITPKLKPAIQNLSNCIIQWAQVKKTNPKNNSLKVKGIELKILNKRFVLEEKAKKIENPFSLLPTKGDFVSCHWNNAIQILSEKQLKNLKKYTKRNLEAINSSKTSKK